jgi:hypothetical protein
MYDDIIGKDRNIKRIYSSGYIWIYYSMFGFARSAFFNHWLWLLYVCSDVQRIVVTPFSFLWDIQSVYHSFMNP